MRPCSRGHVKGLWCIEDRTFMTGPRILKRHINSGGSRGRRGSTPGSRTSRQEPVQPKVSVPRKYQVIPKPTPWIILEPDKKKNFVTDDPPDPSYRELKTGPRSRVSSARKSRPTSGSERSFTGSSLHSVTSAELEGIVDRVSRPTVASRGGVDIAEKFRNKDYVYGSRPCTPNLRHICKPTVASRGGVDIQEKFENKDYVYGAGTATPDVLHEIVDRITRPTVASTGGAGKERDYTDFIYGQQHVSPEQMEDIVSRVTKPTVSSKGGVDLKDKKFEYIKPAKIKTNIIIPGLDTRYMGRKKVSAGKMDDIVERLTQMTPAYTAKYSTNPHVWVDTSARTGPAHQRQMEVS